MWISRRKKMYEERIAKSKRNDKKVACMRKKNQHKINEQWKQLKIK
jgi:hypothetical protein